MVRLQINWKCDLENVALIKVAQPVEDFEWHFRVLCTSCREEHSKVVTFKASDQVPIPGSRGEANFVWKCQFCSRPGSANLEVKSISAYSDEHNSQMQPLVVVECRGMEVTAWECIGDFDVVAESGAEFKNVDLSEKEWVDFDEKSGDPVSILEIISNVVKV